MLATGLHSWPSPSVRRPVKQHAHAWDMKDVMWMFDNSDDVEADTKLLLQLRNEVTEACRSAEKIGSMLEAVPANDHGQKLRKLCAQVKDPAQQQHA